MIDMPGEEGRSETSGQVRRYVGELRLAWALLVLLAFVAFPNSPPVGSIALIVSLLGFLPGALILASARASARVGSEVADLLAGNVGRVSVLAALALAVLVGLIFDAFVALFLIGAAGEVMGLVLLASPRASLARLFPSSTIAAGTTLIVLVAVDAVLNWGPIAYRLGTPSELAGWQARYATHDLKATNFFRFRSAYEDTRRRPGVRRVVALGDSFTEGERVASDDSTWPAQLEHELSAGPDGRPTEVINMGHGGYTTANEAEVLRRVGWQFDPDLVIVQWLDNDAYRSYPNMRYDEAKFVKLIPPRFRSGLIRRSAILTLLERELAVAETPPMRNFYVPDAPGWHELQAALKEMADSARRRGVPILLVPYPYLFAGSWTSASYPERDLTTLVSDVARRDGFEVLDLIPAFATATHPWQDWWARPYDSHPNGAAHHIAAAAIARLIRERHLLPEPTGTGPDRTASGP